MKRTPLRALRPSKPVKDAPFKRVMPVHKAQPQKRTFTDMVRSEATSIPHLVKIDDEEELYEEDITHDLSYGRAELRMENAMEEVNLYQCVCNGELDLNKAARLILRQKTNGTFNQQIYDEFVRSDEALRVSRFCDAGLFNLQDPTEEMRLHSIANFLMCAIQFSKIDRLTRMVEIGEKEQEGLAVDEEGLTISIHNCTREWMLEGPPPFLRTSLSNLIVNYQTKAGDTPFKMFMSLYRYLLIQITDPPESIQTYSLRLNGKGGRSAKLENLPSNVETILLDFAEDTIGYGHPELKSVTANVENTSFFASLGETREERMEVFDRMAHERIAYRRQLFKALQMALRDIRAYEYDVENNKWRIYDRKKKRARPSDANGP